MSIIIETRGTEGLFDRFRSKSKKDGGEVEMKPTTPISEKLRRAAKGTTKTIGAGASGLYQGGRESKDDSDCYRAIRELQKTTDDAKVPTVSRKVDNACGPAKNKNCDKFADAVAGFEDDTQTMLKKSKEGKLCKM